MGGAQLSTHELLKGAARAGWRTSVVSFTAEALRRSAGRRRLAFRVTDNIRSLLGRPVSHCFYGDWYKGMFFGRINRVEKSRMVKAIEKISPDCLITEIGVGGDIWLLRDIVNKIRPDNLIIMVRSVAIDESVFFRSLSCRYRVIANSPYTAHVVEEWAGKKVSYILPVIDFDATQTECSRGQYVTMINPVPEKGGLLLPDIAEALPNTNFLIVKGRWHSSGVDVLFRKLEALSNVCIREFTTDMRQVYKKTRVLLVPSQFEEPFGRVVLEAEYNGIPVVASNRGGLPFSVGKGGVIVEDYNNPRAYVERLQQLLFNPGYYKKISISALSHSQQEIFTKERQVEKFLRSLEHH